MAKNGFQREQYPFKNKDLSLKRNKLVQNTDMADLSVASLLLLYLLNVLEKFSFKLFHLNLTVNNLKLSVYFSLYSNIICFNLSL